jgi:SAM-dependent methyltransferase
MAKDKNWSKRAQAFWEQRQKKAAPGGFTGYLLDESPASIGRHRFEGEWAQLKGFLASEAVPRGQCLDVGCGTGEWLAALAGEFKRAEGWDYSPAMIKASRRRLSQAGVRNATVKLGPVTRRQGAAVFDLIFVGGVIMYTPEKELGALLQSLARLLKPDGLLVLRESSIQGKTWQRQGLPLRAGLLAGGGLDRSDYVAVYRSPQALQAALAKAGLRLDSVGPNFNYKVSDITEDWLRRLDGWMGGRLGRNPAAAGRWAAALYHGRFFLHYPEIFIRHALGILPWKLENYWFLAGKA